MTVLNEFASSSQKASLIRLHIHVTILPATRSVWHERRCQVFLFRPLPLVDLDNGCVRMAENAGGSMPSGGPVTNELLKICKGATAACGHLHFRCWHHLGSRFSAAQLHNTQTSLHFPMLFVSL